MDIASSSLFSAPEKSPYMLILLCSMESPEHIFLFQPREEDTKQNSITYIYWNTKQNSDLESEKLLSEFVFHQLDITTASFANDFDHF